MEENYISKAYKIASDCASKLNLTIEDVEWVKEADTYILRILADSDNGLDINQASDLNEMISEELDKDDFIKEEYMLEVSSPGLERELKKDSDILKAINDYVHVEFNNNFSINKDLSVKELEGTLISYNDNVFNVKVNIKGRLKTVEFKKENIKLIRKAIKF